MKYINNPEINKLVNNKLNKYLGFDVQELLSLGDHAYIFGGAIRDILTNNKINDIDITGLPKSLKTIDEYLINMGFDPSLANNDLYEDSIM